MNMNPRAFGGIPMCEVDGVLFGQLKPVVVDHLGLNWHNVRRMLKRDPFLSKRIGLCYLPMSVGSNPQLSDQSGRTDPRLQDQDGPAAVDSSTQSGSQSRRVVCVEIERLPIFLGAAVNTSLMREAGKVEEADELEVRVARLDTILLESLAERRGTVSSFRPTPDHRFNETVRVIKLGQGLLLPHQLQPLRELLVGLLAGRAEALGLPFQRELALAPPPPTPG